MPIPRGMDALDRLGRLLRVNDDALATHRPRIVRVLSVVMVAVLLPFTLNHLLAGAWLLAGLLLAAQVALAVNVWRQAGQRAVPVPYWLIALCMSATVCLLILHLGAAGSYWAFPAALACYLLLERRLALLFSTGMLTAYSLLVWQTLGAAQAARLAATLAITLTMVNVVLNALADLQDALLHQALTDPLTGAYNRRHLAEQLQCLARPAPDVYGMNALLAIDIDDFKRINDVHGHAAGDAVLVACVQTLAARKRQSDTLFRTGGEEFVLLLPRTSAIDARHVAESLRARIAETPLLPGHAITVSIGVGVQQPHHSADDWMQAADRALYRAKRNGRNRVETSA